jgi:peptidoglycan hydrolase-like protein with peptidoglycan-binding domain
MSGHPTRARSRRWLLVAGGCAVLAGAGTAAAAVHGDDRPAPAGPAPHRTAPVARTTLVEGQTFKGSIEYGEPAPLQTRLGGTVTRLPDAGQVLGAGDALCWLDNQPVVLLAGTTPAYRALGAGTKGPDVRQLETNLRSLGFGGFTGDDTFTPSTAAAVKRWQKHLGLAQTGAVELGRVVFRPGPVRVGALKVRVGDPVGGGTVLFDATGTQRRVALSVDLKHRPVVPVGGAATVLLPGGTATAGVVSTVTEQAGEQPKLAVTVAVADQAAIGDADRSSVEVRLVVRERKDVLAVPIVALLALDGEGYGVEVVTGRSARVVPVQLGMFAAGKVEIRGDGITEGTLVSVPGS